MSLDFTINSYLEAKYLAYYIFWTAYLLFFLIAFIIALLIKKMKQNKYTSISSIVVKTKEYNITWQILFIINWVCLAFAFSLFTISYETNLIFYSLWIALILSPILYFWKSFFKYSFLNILLIPIYIWFWFFMLLYYFFSKKIRNYVFLKRKIITNIFTKFYIPYENYAENESFIILKK